jgi:hypothetical protein
VRRVTGSELPLLADRARNHRRAFDRDLRKTQRADLATAHALSLFALLPFFSRRASLPDAKSAMLRKKREGEA